jgi:hypothetical protein
MSQLTSDVALVYYITFASETAMSDIPGSVKKLFPTSQASFFKNLPYAHHPAIGRSAFFVFGLSFVSGSFRRPPRGNRLSFNYAPLNDGGTDFNRLVL